MNTKDNLAKAFIYTLLMALVYVLSIYLPRMHYALALIIGAALFVTIILNPLVGLIAIALTSEYTNIEKAISLPAGLSTDLFLGLAVFSGFILEKVRRRSTTLQKSPYDMPMAYIILFLSIGILAGSNSGYNQFTDNLQILSFLKIISLVSIYYITYNILDSKRKIRIVFNSILIGTAAVGGISILLYMMNIQNPIPNIEVFTGDPSGLKRLQGFSEDPNNFATFFAYLIPYPIIMLLYKKKRVEKIYYNLLAVIFLTSTILTFSRSEWIAALTSLVVAYILICKQVQIRLFSLPVKRIVFSIMLLSCLTGVLLIFVINFISPNLILERVESVISSDSLQYRFVIFQGYMKLILDNPLGIGFTDLEDVVHGILPKYNTTHNSFLAVGVYGGIPAVISLVYLVVLQLRHYYKAITSSVETEAKLRNIAYLSGIIGYWIHNLFHTNLFILLPWVFIAVTTKEAKFTDRK